MLETKQLTYTIDNKNLIEDITLQFHPGILYGILGPNGSGKSTLLKNLTGIWQPTSGKVQWKGEDLLSLPRLEISKTITLVPQNPQIHFDFTVSDMVAMGRYPYTTRHRSEVQDLLEWTLKTVDAWHLKDRSILRLSQGERKRVYIARALITGSPVLLLDEPSTSLDIKHQIEIWILLKKLIGDGKTIVVTNHDLVATKRFCDEVAILNHGHCISRGRSSDVFSHELLETVFGVTESPDMNGKQYTLIS